MGSLCSTQSATAPGARLEKEQTLTWSRQAVYSMHVKQYSQNCLNSEFWILQLCSCFLGNQLIMDHISLREKNWLTSHHHWVGWLLGFYILATSKVITGWVPSCDSAQSWWFYSVAPLGNQATSTMTQSPSQSHCSDTEPNRPCRVLLMLNARLGSNKYQFYTSLVNIAPRQYLDGWTFRVCKAQ